MSPLKKLIIDTIQSELLPFSFQKDGSIWFKRSEDILVMLQLDKSTYGFDYYRIYLGIHVMSIAEPNAVYTKKGAIRAAVGNWQLLEEVADGELAAALDSESKIPDSERVRILLDSLNNQILPRLRIFEDRESLSKYIFDTGALVTLSLRRWLGFSGVV